MVSYHLYQKNDVYSGLGDDSSTSEPKESKAKEERKEQHRKVEETTADQQHVEEGGTEGTNANDKQNSDEAPRDSARSVQQSRASGVAVQTPQTDDDR